MSQRKRSALLPVLAAVVCFLAVSCLADSQARIVRLSDVEGDVQIDRATGEGFEKAFDNFPITQGVKLKTRAEGRAEVEFEDGSTLRLAPFTTIEFPALSLRDSGAKLSTVNVETGIVYVNYAGKNNDDFSLNFAKEHVAVTNAAHFRLLVASDGSMVSVFNGMVNVEGPGGPLEVDKKHSARFLTGQDDEPKLAKNVPELDFDAWDKSQQQYHDRYMAKSYTSYSPYAYGVSDLNYYGNFMSLPGYGMVWQPYFIDAGWNPYMNGAWASYPGVGYSWVSAYPWGWTPYHYGSWINVPGNGWVWMPGGAWAGFGRTPMIAGGSRSLLPQAPVGTGRTVIVNRGPATTVSNSRPDKVVIRNGSAGLGLARGGVRNPAELSQRAAIKGTVTTHVRTAPATMQPGYFPSSAAAGQSGAAYGRTMTAPSARPMSSPGTSNSGRGMGGMGGSAPSRPSSASSGSTRR